jgi:transposase
MTITSIASARERHAARQPLEAGSRLQAVVGARRRDLSDDEWAVLGPLLPRRRRRQGRPAHDARAVLNGILWHARTGLPWRGMPARYGRWSAVYRQYNRWKQSRRWDAVAMLLSQRIGRGGEPAAGRSRARGIPRSLNRGGNDTVRTLTQATVVPALLLIVCGSARASETRASATLAFPLASVHFEQNATDGDFEVVFEVKGGKDGLAELVVVAPDGRPVVTFKAPDASTLGIRSFRFESPEPPDMQALRAAYPEGVYAFSGRTASGATFVGRSTLSHRLPATTTFVQPLPKQTNVPVKNFRLSWSAVEGVTSYAVGIKQAELNVNFAALLPGSSTSFAVPEGLLVPGRQYKAAIGTVTREGNISFVETTFTTGQ